LQALPNSKKLAANKDGAIMGIDLFVQRCIF